MMTRRLLGLCLLLPTPAVLAHHSVSAYFDNSQVAEVQGELIEVRWINPHLTSQRFLQRQTATTCCFR